MVQAERKHKPSPKHALDDVLSSLQDLMRNELSSEPPAPLDMARRRSRTASVTRGGGKISTGDVLNSLKNLIEDGQTRPADDNDIVIEALPVKDSGQVNDDVSPTALPADPSPIGPAEMDIDIETVEIEAVPIEDEPSEMVTDAPVEAAIEVAKTAPATTEQEPGATLADTEPVEEAPSAPMAPEKESVPEAVPDQPLFGGEQLEVDFDIDLGDKSTTAVEPKVDTFGKVKTINDYPADDEVEDTITLTPDETTTGRQDKDEQAPMIGEKAGHPTSLEQVEINWNDVPVLEDVALNPLSGKAGAPATPPPTVASPTPSADSRLTPAATPSLPPGGVQARDIALKAIAKLNIQLRKSGKRSLEPLMVDRLQYVLKEILDQGGSNMDNKPSKSKK